MYGGCLNVMSSWDWGSAPEWVGGVGGAAAFLLAARVYSRAKEDDQKAQARRIYFQWTRSQDFPKDAVADVTVGYAERGSFAIKSGNNDGYLLAQNVNITFVTVHNHSDEIAHNVRVAVTEDSQWFPDNVAYVIRDLAPGEKVDLSFTVHDGSHAGTTVVALDPEISMTFTDAGGRHWERSLATPVRKVKRNPYHAVFELSLIEIDRNTYIDGRT
ncbi:hypothetical protein [Aeromicrobium sp. CnD17-E]|uniref:hypothetical protein n=1 Tax=Aeromicrobium sp. CnD17-E TaxID=2954487 RepID=UPI0020968570|nr:hypothetical protein [Aeromicrobium sp. CnD17-E]MCO7239070.1 hypothetical protein [Aeromicrobium sp. CnD17-E]